MADIEIPGRLSTRRNNPHERRTDPEQAIRDCEHSCPVAIRNHERIEAAFGRIDQERAARNQHELKASHRMEKMEGEVGLRIKMSMFVWIIGGLATLYGAVLGVVWAHVNSVDNKTQLTVEYIERLSVENSRKIDVTVSRINDFVSNHEQILARQGVDQERILRQMEELNRVVRSIQMKLGQWRQGPVKGLDDRFPVE